MAANGRTAEQVRREIEEERQHLAVSVEHLRDEIGQAANITGKIKSKLPAVAGAAGAAGFVLAGGVGATMRYFARRGRERDEKLRVGRWSIFDRD